MLGAEEIKALMAKNKRGAFPCPFCRIGTQLAYRQPPKSQRMGDDEWMVFCTRCGASGSYEESFNNAIAAWNTRAYTPALFTLQTLLNQAAEALLVEQKRAKALGVSEPLARNVKHTLAAIEPYLTKEGE